MREVTCTVYTADELREQFPRGFARAKEWFNSGGYDRDHPSIHDYAREFSDVTGVVVDVEQYRTPYLIYGKTFSVRVSNELNDYHDGELTTPPLPLPDSFGIGMFWDLDFIAAWNDSDAVRHASTDGATVARAVATAWGALFAALDDDLDDQASDEYFVDAADANDMEFYGTGEVYREDSN